MKEIEKILKLAPKKRKELLNWFAGKSLEIMLRICKVKSVTLTVWKSKYKGQNVTTSVEQAELASLLDAIAKIKRDLEGGKTEKAFEVRVLEAKAKSKAKKSPAATDISNNYLQLIHKLRGEAMSWRRIQEYIKTYHRKTFAFSTIRDVYQSEYGTDAI